DVSNAPSSFAGMTLSAASNQAGVACTFTVSDNGQSATLTVATNGTASLADPNHLFSALGTGQSIVIHSDETITDTHGSTSTPTMHVTCNGANDAPVAHADDFSVSEDDAFNAPSNTLVLGNVLANDTDADGELVLFSSSTHVPFDVSNAPSSFAGMTL